MSFTRSRMISLAKKQKDKKDWEKVKKLTFYV
jgi:hypothetical protein